MTKDADKMTDEELRERCLGIFAKDSPYFSFEYVSPIARALLAKLDAKPADLQAQLDQARRELAEANRQFNELLCIYEKVAQQLIEARASTPVSVPEGHKLVPLEPTEEMQKAAEDKDIASDFNCPWQYVELYKAMLAAAPKPGAQVSDTESPADRAET